VLLYCKFQLLQKDRNNKQNKRASTIVASAPFNFAGFISDFILDSIHFLNSPRISGNHLRVVVKILEGRFDFVQVVPDNVTDPKVRDNFVIAPLVESAF